MKDASPRHSRANRIATRTQKTLLPLVAVGGGLAGLPASALELGDMTVQSHLGQPLRASIAYALAPHEQLSGSCVTLGLGATPSGLPGIGRATISIANGSILLRGQTPVREPMVAAQIIVDCAYTANISREYSLFIDPAPVTVAEGSTLPAAAPAPRRESTVPARRNAAASATNRAPIGKASRYRVQPGDSLSQIAARIENRPVGLWSAVNTIFAANPDAFIGNDMNKLKAGSWLSIPSFDGSEPVVSAAIGTQGSPAVVPNESAGSPRAAGDAAPVATVSVTAPTKAVLAADEKPSYDAATLTQTPNLASDATADLAPAVVNSAEQNPFVDGAETVNETVVIPDTRIEGPTTESASPNITTAVIAPSSSESSSSSWLLWLAGSGLAIFVGLLLFGRLFRGRPVESTEAQVADHPSRRATDLESDGIEVITHTSTILDDEAPTAENLSLDADLVMGTGLDEGTDVDMEVAQDFGFAATTDLDLELPFEPEPSVDPSDTGIFLAADDDPTAVLDKNSLSDSDDDEYDLSVVLDATKMPRPEDITQRDLQAVEVDTAAENDRTGSYTISNEVDLEILERDYEDELTATQALNAELARAAAEVTRSNKSGEAVDDYEVTSEMTAGLPSAPINELDATTEMPIRGKQGDDIDTDIHEAVTIEMPAAENDETAEIELDGGTIDTKAI